VGICGTTKMIRKFLNPKLYIIALVTLCFILLKNGVTDPRPDNNLIKAQKGETNFMKVSPTIQQIDTSQIHITTKRLPSGITLVHQEIKKNPIVSIFVFNTKAGLIYENKIKNKRGITHLMQSLITKGTKTRNSKQISDDAERIGSAISASTDKDYASIEMTVPSQNFSKAIELLSDIIKNPTFPEQEFNKEKEATAAAIRSRKDRIFTIADDLANLNFYGEEHPYSTPETGTLKTLSSIKRKDIIEWHKKTYLHPTNLVISIAGDIDLNTSTEMIEKFFADLTTTQDNKNHSTEESYNGQPQPQQKEVVEKHDFKQAYLMITWPAPQPGFDNGYPELKFLAGALGSRMSGRLFRILREKHSLAYEVNAYYPTRKLDGRFTIYIGLDKSNLDIAREQINTIINDIKTNGISNEEMEETRRFLKGVWTLKKQTTSSKAFYNGYWTVLTQDPSSDVKYINRILSVTKENLIDTARKYLDNSKSVTVTIIPQK